MRHSEVQQVRHGPHGSQQLVVQQLDVEHELVVQHGSQLVVQQLVLQHGSQQSSQLLQLWPNSTAAPTPRYGVQSSRSKVHDKWVKSEWDRPLVRAMLSELQERKTGLDDVLICLVALAAASAPAITR